MNEVQPVKMDSSRAIYTVAVLCVLAIFTGAFMEMEIHSRMAKAEKRIDEFEAMVRRYYQSVQLERGSDTRVDEGRFIRLERAVGLTEPWNSSMAIEYLNSGDE